MVDFLSLSAVTASAACGKSPLAKARRAETDSGGTLYVVVLMHVVAPESLNTSGRHASMQRPKVENGAAFPPPVSVSSIILT
jgi:hypothetical protein